MGPAASAPTPSERAVSTADRRAGLRDAETDASGGSRIPPIEPPYDREMTAALRKWMPPDSELDPLAIYRTLFVHPDLAGRMRVVGAGILAHGLILPREREVVILRICARAGAEYEWGVHVFGFAEAVGLTGEQVMLTVQGDADHPSWSARDRLLVRLSDELYDTASLSDELWHELRAAWTPPQLIELIVTAGWYRTIAGLVNATKVELEAWAPRFPLRTSAGPNKQARPRARAT